MKKMKDFYTGILVGLVVVGLVLGAGFVGYIQSHYTRMATISAVARDGLVTALDDNNHKWSFYGDNYGVGEKVVLKMFTNHTDNNIYDDEIISVKIVDTLK